MASEEGWTQAQLDFCADVAKGVDQYEAYARHYSAGPGYRANCRAKIKKTKIAERIAAVREKAGIIVADDSEALAELDIAQRRHFDDLTAELSRTTSSGSRVKLLKMRSELLKRTRPKATTPSAPMPSKLNAPTRPDINDLLALLFTTEENKAFAEAERREAALGPAASLPARHDAVMSALPQALRICAATSRN